MIIVITERVPSASKPEEAMVVSGRPLDNLVPDSVLKSVVRAVAHESAG